MDEPEADVGAVAVVLVLPRDPGVGRDRTVDLGHQDVRRRVAVGQVGVVVAHPLDGRDLRVPVCATGRVAHVDEAGKVGFASPAAEDETRDGRRVGQHDGAVRVLDGVGCAETSLVMGRLP